MKIENIYIRSNGKVITGVYNGNQYKCADCLVDDDATGKESIWKKNQFSLKFPTKVIDAIGREPRMGDVIEGARIRLGAKQGKSDPDRYFNEVVLEGFDKYIKCSTPFEAGETVSGSSYGCGEVVEAGVSSDSAAVNNNMIVED